MKRFYLFYLVFSLYSSLCFAQTKQEILGQSKKYPLYTSLDHDFLNEFNKAFTFGHFKKENAIAFREKLMPFVKNNDPLALMLYARTYDWFEFGQGVKEDVPIAIKYYKKAAQKKFARANYFLNHVYRYGFLDIKKNDKKSKNYLQKVIRFGDSSLKSMAYNDLAIRAYGDSTHRGYLEKTLNYLYKAYELNPDNTHTIDFIASTQIQKENYEEAFKMLLKTDNYTMHIRAAKWMLEGEKVKMDKEKAINLLLTDLNEYKKDQEGFAFSELLLALNTFYYCDKLIPDYYKEKIDPFLSPSFPCD